MDWFSPSTMSGLAIAALAAVSVATVASGVSLRGRRMLSLLAVVAIGAVAFQAVHFIEHLAQLGYWVLNPAHKPWITPWATGAVDGLAWMCGPIGQERPGLGVEKLHLLGNAIFLAGVAAVALLARKAGYRIRDIAGLNAVLLVQGFHVFEHVMLTSSVALGFPAAGISTGFGQMSGEALIAYRVWFHFLVNLVATILALVAVASLHRRGLLLGPIGEFGPARNTVARFAARARRT